MVSCFPFRVLICCVLWSSHTHASTELVTSVQSSSNNIPTSTLSLASTSANIASTKANSPLGSTSSPSPPSCLPSFIAPIAIPIHNVTLQGPRDGIVRRGAEVFIGTPPQPLAFIISDQTNNTAIFDIHNQCYMDAGANYTKPNSTAAGCFSFYGGAFNESKSSTWTDSSSFSALGAPEDSINWFGPIGYGTDNIMLSSNVTTTKSPLLIDYGRTGYEAFFMSTIGLGINSTLLNTLVSTGKIASRTWSLFNGFVGTQSQNQSDGILVLGGYDEAKISGSVLDNITLDFDLARDTSDIEDCPATGMIITINNMTLAWPNGTKAGLLGSSKANKLAGCVIPNYDYITLTNEMWQSFVSLTGSEPAGRSNSPLSWFQNLITADSAFTGDLVISIHPGLDITIPNHDLVRSFVDINATTGEEYIADSSKRVMGVYAEDSQTANNIIALGRTFLTGAYLMVDADRQQFTIWKGQSSTEQNLKAHGPSLCLDAAATTSPTSAPVPPAASHIDSGSAIPKSAIAGISVALISIAAVSAGVVYFLARKWKHAKAMHDDSGEQERKYSSLEASESNNLQNSEIPSDHDHQPPQEISSGKHAGEAIAPFEMIGTDVLPNEMAAQTISVELAANEDFAKEIASGDRSPVSPMELPSTSLVRASEEILPLTQDANNHSVKSAGILKKTPLPNRLIMPKKISRDSPVSPM